MRIFTAAAFAATCLCSSLCFSSAGAAGIDCNSLEKWKTVDGYTVNQHHVFCGEINRRGKAVGFHSMPKRQRPSTILSYDGVCNVPGIYTLRNIQIDFHGEKGTKSMSTMFPNACTMEQVNKSIAYSAQHSTGKCSSPGWANCGPSAPSRGDTFAYCTTEGGKPFTIASAFVGGTKKINTGFPVQ